MRFWFLVLKDVVRRYVDDDCGFLASGIAFYAFLSLFPVCLVGVSFFSWILSFPFIHQQVILGFSQLGTPPNTADGLGYTIRLVQSLLPTQSSWIESELAVLASHIGRNVIISVIVGLWSGRHMFMAMENSLNRVWDIPTRRNWVASSLVCMYLILVTAGAFVALLAFAGLLALIQSIISSYSLPSFMGFSLDQALLWSWVNSWVFIPLGASALFLMMYRLLPAETMPVAFLIPGALFSGVAWKLLSLAYLEYGIRFGSISAFYGSIWYLVGLLTWLYVVAVVFLVGAELIYAYNYRLEQYKLKVAAAKRAALAITGTITPSANALPAIEPSATTSPATADSAKPKELPTASSTATP